MFDFFAELNRAAKAGHTYPKPEPEVTVLRFKTPEQRQRAAMRILVTGELKVKTREVEQ
jgi:hypothetical protein